MFTDRLFSTRGYPPRLFPRGIGSLGHQYGKILRAIRDLLQATEPFNSVRVPIVIRDEPFPLAGGPCAYIIPEDSTTIEGQHMGDGRYLYGFTGEVTIRVADSSLVDYTYSDMLRLTKDTTGLMRIAHKVIDILDIQFVDSSNGIALTQEPMVLVSQDPARIYRKASNIGAIDLRFRFPYTVDFSRDEEYDDPTGLVPAPTNLADLLLSVRDKVLKEGFLNDFQTIISLTRDPFPLVGGPFAVINAGRFTVVEGDKYGAGRNYASMNGTFTISPVVQNLTDITGYADNAIIGSSKDISLYSCVQYLIEQLCLCWLHDSSGNSIAETPLDLVNIGVPRYYQRASNYVTCPLTFRTKYQEDLT